jgi:hypothetical protein
MGAEFSLERQSYDSHQRAVAGFKLDHSDLFKLGIRAIPSE